MDKKPFLGKPGAQLLIVFIFYYLLLIIFFNKLVFQPFDLANAPDYISGIVIVDVSEKLSETGPPLWTPYFCGGMPCMASLQHPLFTYPIFGWDITGKLLTVLFINPLMEPNMRLMLIHLLMAGLFTYLLARSLGLSWFTGLFCGLIFMFTPQLIVLPNVGHGSKLFSASYIPLVLLAIKRLMDRRRLGDFALAGFVVGMILLSFHVQMAFYGLLAGGMYLVWSIIFDIREKPIRIPLKAILFIGVILIGVCFAASAYFPIYEYSPHSIRGGAEGGLEWDYATMWSFHPLESMTYLIPSFFGFGGGTYWGYQPFTDMPLYWGIGALFFAVIAAVYFRSRIVWFFLVLWAFAWMVSWGNYMPVIFKPMFEIMPFFNRFRVPVMIQILMVFSVAMLAGFGLEKIKELVEKGKSAKWILYTAGTILGIALLITVLQTPATHAFGNWISAIRPKIPAQYHSMLFKLAFTDLWKFTAFALAIMGLLYAYLKAKVKFSILVGGVIILLIVDLWIVNAKLINPTPHSNLQAMLQPTPAVEFLQQQEKPFRIYPLDRFRTQNWYGYFGIESIDGYLGTKMKRYQELIDGVGLTNFNIINMMNSKYFLTDQELPSNLPVEKVLDGKQKIYRNLNCLPRCWIVHNIVSVPRAEDRFTYLKSFNPRTTAIVEENIDLPPGEGGVAAVTDIQPLEVKVRTDCVMESFLVLSEIYYAPYWKAYIDGQETQIYPTNHILRGVKVPAGEHDVVFKCESTTYKLGWIFHYVTAAGLLFVLVIYLIPRLISLTKKRTG